MAIWGFDLELNHHKSNNLETCFDKNSATNNCSIPIIFRYFRVACRLAPTFLSFDASSEIFYKKWKVRLGSKRK